MEILAKFGSALSGFWWALDDHERKALIIGVVWVGAVAWHLSIAGREKERQLDELADRVAERINHG